MTTSATPAEIPEVAKIHYFALRKYLDAYLQKGTDNKSKCLEQNGVSTQRQSAREKLTKLFPHQFEELSTDVYDEMLRRQNEEEGIDSCLLILAPFLPVQSEYHPKRNQARQKLATLSVNRFKDLASDVHAELERRYPLLKDSINDEVNEKGVKEESEVKDKQENTDNNDKEAKDLMGMVNFKSLDNLMADLGSMIANNSDESPLSKNVETSLVVRALFAYFQDDVPPAYKTMDHNKTFEDSANLQDQIKELQNELDKNKKNASDALAEAYNQLNTLREENRALKKEIAEKNPEKYLAQVNDLKAKLEKADKDLKDAISKHNKAENENRQLQQDLQNEQKNSASAKSEIRNLQNGLEKAKKDAENIKSLKEKEVKGKMESLESQIQSLTSDLEKLRAERDEKDNKIKVLMAETERSRASPQQSLESNKSLKKTASLRVSTGGRVALRSPPNSSTQNTASPAVIEDYTNIPNQIDLNSPTLAGDKGLIEVNDVNSFKNAILELLKAGRADTPAGVLIAMKSIVVATRSISETVETYESTSEPPLTPTDLDKTANLRNQLSSHLTNLMTAAKNHATGVGNSVSILDRAAYDLTIDILDIIKLIKLSNGKGPADKKAFTSSANGNQQDQSQKQALDNLKSFLEQQTDLIVQNIQTLLQNMRQNSFGNEFKETITNITAVVDNLGNVSRSTLNEHSTPEQKQRGTGILKLLSESNTKLGEMGSSMVNSTQKPSKQKLAAAAYEVAKFTKELVSLFDSDA